MVDSLLVASVLLSLVFRWLVAIGPHSGEGKAPMFGDYEAQRHWMEITLHLPVAEWYRNGTNNDLMYWGLDYPPLTAYHSLLLGYIGNMINSSWFALYDSRGLESYHHKVFARATVIVADLIVYIPALVAYVWLILKPKTRQDKIIYTLSWLLYPGLILVDHGHFQYNCVSLGLLVWSVLLIVERRELLGSVAFCLALNYKQLELYHAFPIFCCLLGRVLHQRQEYRLWKLSKIATVTVCSFLILWSPFLLDGSETTLAVIRRLFPFDRGLYEDKVANFWCASSILIKWRNILSLQQLIRICGLTTLVALIPSSIMLLMHPNKQQFIISLVISSLSFFLFSFHVHEKGILLVAIPSMLLIRELRENISWFLLISTVSMYPLFVKDEIRIAYFALICAYYIWLVDVFRLKVYVTQNFKGPTVFSWQNLFLHLSFLGGFLLSILSIVIPPPPRYPDLWPVLLSAYCCALFLLFLLYLHCYQFSCLRMSLKQAAGTERKKAK